MPVATAQPSPGTLTTPKVCAATGVTYRQLDYWIRLGVLPLEGGCPGSGFARTWQPVDVGVVAVLAKLSRFGVKTVTLRRVAGLLYRAAGDDNRPLPACVLVVPSVGDPYLTSWLHVPDHPAVVVPLRATADTAAG